MKTWIDSQLFWTLKEDLVEVLSDLRQEETAAGGSLLVPQILPKPQPIPPTTLKRKPKTGKFGILHDPIGIILWLIALEQRSL